MLQSNLAAFKALIDVLINDWTSLDTDALKSKRRPADADPSCYYNDMHGCGRVCCVEYSRLSSRS